MSDEELIERALVVDLMEQMGAAGEMVELHRTQNAKFLWSFGWRANFQAPKQWTYGRTAMEAVQRGHARWCDDNGVPE